MIITIIMYWIAYFKGITISIEFAVISGIVELIGWFIILAIISATNN